MKINRPSLSFMKRGKIGIVGNWYICRYKAIGEKYLYLTVKFGLANIIGKLQACQG